LDLIININKVISHYTVNIKIMQQSLFSIFSVVVRENRFEQAHNKDKNYYQTYKDRDSRKLKRLIFQYLEDVNIILFGQHRTIN